MSITLERIIANLEKDAAAAAPAAEKTASAPAETKEASAASTPEDVLLATVREISEKTAADLGELSKIAADVAQAESTSMVEQAKLAGAALCDGFMERLAAYEGEIAKTAAAAQPAAPSEELLKAAYAQGRADLEKEAQAAFDQGHEAALQQIHKIATEIHVAGQQSARNVLEALRKEAGEKA
jgi:hypothetical protein